MSWVVSVLFFCLVGISLQANVFLRFGHLSVAASPSLTFQVDDSATTLVDFSSVSLFKSFAVKNGSKITASSPNITFTQTLEADPAEGSYWSFWIVPSTPASRRRRFVKLSNSSKPLFFQEKLPSPVFNTTTVRVRAINVVPGTENTPFTLVNNITQATVTLNSKTYATDSDYTTLPSGYYNISGCNTSSGLSLLTAGFVYTVYNYGGDLGQFQCEIKVDQGLDQNGAQVSVIHSSPDTPDVTVTFGLTTAKVGFGQQSTYQTTLAQNANYAVSLGGTVVLSGQFNLVANQQYSLLISGFSNTSRTGKPLAVKLIQDELPKNATSAVRLMNLVPDLVSTLRAVINGQNFILDYATPSPLIFLPNGNFLLQIFNVTAGTRRALSEDKPILSQTVSVSAQGITSVLIEGTADNITVTQTNPTPPPVPGDNGSSGLSGGAIAGIVIASIFGAILIAGLLVYFYRRANYQSIP